ncbi:hypothetical protein, partial [Escherichia sp. MOD1-EC5950]|uniref:hypothetical protein n=1 Tax=Escherichia sp. MOD1-EC5950 TaxID=2093879 RepID=UPI001F2836DE
KKPKTKQKTDKKIVVFANTNIASRTGFFVHIWIFIKKQIIFFTQKMNLKSQKILKCEIK